MKHTYEAKNNARGAYGVARLIGRCAVAMVLVLSMLLLVACTPAPADQGDMALTVSSSSAKPGDTGIQVQVMVENNPGWFAFIFTPVYDTTRLVLRNTQVNIADMGGDQTIGNRIVWLGDDADSTFNGTIITFTFDVLPDAPAGDAKVTLEWAEGDICNYDEEDLYPSIVPGYIAVGNE